MTRDQHTALIALNRERYGVQQIAAEPETEKAAVASQPQTPTPKDPGGTSTDAAEKW